MSKKDQKFRKETLNIPLLRKVRAAIESERNGFDMQTWGVVLAPSSGAPSWWPTHEDEAVHEDYFRSPRGVTAESCGTPACLAGWAIRLTGDADPSAKRLGCSVSIGRTASEVLGLEKAGIARRYSWSTWRESPEQEIIHHPLFWHGYWPEGYEHGSPSARRESAIRLLTELIKGNDPWEDA